jgi:galactokinase
MLSIQADSLISQNAFTVWNRDRTESLRERLKTWYDEQHLNTLSPSEPVNWPSYIRGVLAYLLDNNNLASPSRGFNVVIISDVPCNKGVASSAALEVAVAGAGNFDSWLRRHLGKLFL